MRWRTEERWLATGILSLDTQPERFLTSEKQDVLVDFVVKWRIDNVECYFTATRGDELRA